MKIAIIISLLFVVLVFPACKKQAEPPIKKVDVNATVAARSEFEFALKQYFSGGEFPIVTTPPKTSRLSTIIYNDTAIGAVYHYIPHSPAGSTDKVIIKIVREHEHDPLAVDEHKENDDYTSVIITINFSIN